MRRVSRWVLIAAGLLLPVSLFYAVETVPADDTQLRAMSDELARSVTLHLNNLDKPYFISYGSNDTQENVVNASLGGILKSAGNHARHPALHVRVGSYAFDNTDSVYSQLRQTGYLPIDDDYNAIRNALWISTDGLYKAAIDEITRKRTALREIADADKTPDFARQPAVHIVDTPEVFRFDRSAWEPRLRRTSAAFSHYPDIADSDLNLLAVGSTFRLVNSEGSVIRIPQDLVGFRIIARAYAPDGSHVWDHVEAVGLHPSELPGETEITRMVEATAKNIEALRQAPLMDDYTGPVLFEQQAAAQVMAEIITDAERLLRKPVVPVGSTLRAPVESVWASRIGTRVAPDWLTLVDDPTRTEFGGKPLAGAYQADDEGVPGARVNLVEGGVLRNFLLTRQPVGKFTESNGHGRLPGAYGSQLAVMGNLFVEAGQTVPEAEMKTRLIAEVKAAGLPYGMLIRRLDFPIEADRNELQRLVHSMQAHGYVRTISEPLLAYRVYADGREQLVRGAMFREFSAKNLRDLELASSQPYVLNFMNNGSAFQLPGAGDSTSSSIISPSLLFDGVEISRSEGDESRPPVVAAPALVPE